MVESASTKPRVATVIVLGMGWKPKFEDKQPCLFGQVRGFYNPNNGQPLKGSPGERSIFGEHLKEGVDADSRAAAKRCAEQEFWFRKAEYPLTRDDFIPLAENVDTEKSINDVFLFRRCVVPELMAIGEGDALLHIPLDQVPWYVNDGNLTEASIATLAAVPDLKTTLWGMTDRMYF